MGAVRLPARDIGPPYLARFAAVSATGPLVTIEEVTLVPVVGSVAVTEVVVASPVGAGIGIVEVDDGMVASLLADGELSGTAGWVLSGFGWMPSGAALWGVTCAKAAPLIRADAATAVRMILSFMGWVSC